MKLISLLKILWYASGIEYLGFRYSDETVFKFLLFIIEIISELNFELLFLLFNKYNEIGISALIIYLD